MKGKVLQMDTTTKEHRQECIRIAAELKAMGYKCRGERVVVVRDPAAEKIGRIHVPDAGKRKPIRGTLVALGTLIRAEDLEHDLHGVAVLDRCAYTKYNPILIEIPDSDGRMMELEVMHASDIYVTWKDARLG